jgi:dephospho-CoA kinase
VKENLRYFAALTCCAAEVRLGTMQIIILTGTIGSGKSTVAAILKQLGAAVIDSDAVARHVIDPGTSAFQAVVESFGTDILTASQSIDRKKLAARVFNDPVALKNLNRITHPQVDAEVESLFEEYLTAGKKAVFVEMAFLAETSWKDRVDQVWVVKTPQTLALRRLEERGLGRSEALARLANQPLAENQIKNGLEIIINDGNLDQLKEQVAKLWHKIDNEDR